MKVFVNALKKITSKHEQKLIYVNENPEKRRNQTHMYICFLVQVKRNKRVD